MRRVNGTEFNIFNIKTNEKVGTHYQEAMSTTHWHDLLDYTPMEDHTIQPWGYHTNHEYWAGDKMPLKGFYESITDRTVKNVWDNPDIVNEDEIDVVPDIVIIPIQEFIDNCLSGTYIDYDGYGITVNESEDIILPSEVRDYGWEVPQGVTHIQWCPDAHIKH